MNEWRPIANAPKDGTKLLLFIPEYRQPIHIGWFHDSTTIEYGKVARESRHWMTGAWPSFSTDKNPEPSHWMPLPAHPVA